jgi:protein tyrosine phosphatase
VQSDATMNQMRNAIYHLQRFMKNNNISEIRQRFHRMGQNIAHTYIKNWKPIEKVEITNIKNLIATIYKNILNSSVSIEINDNEKLIIIKDNDCALCKYYFEDIQISGCEIIAAMVAEFIQLINKQNTSGASFSIHPMEIRESRTFGNKSCIQQFKYNNGGK